jgi:hypothetical protein
MDPIRFSSAWLWGGVFVVALVSTSRLLWMWLKRQRAPETDPKPAREARPWSCPACRRAFVAGTQYCPVDASRLVPNVEGAAALAPGRGGRCPRCRRAFEGGMRFCPMDAEELVPMSLWQPAHAEGGLHAELFADHLVGGQGKICPVCASRYDLEAGYCGRDASALVTVN